MSEPMDIAMRLLKMPQEAKDYATQIHEGQMYGEQPYMTHVEDVASGFDDPHLQRIAYLHDTVEDSETGIGEIHERFGEDVGHAVDALTRRQGEQYFDYINRVKEHPEATQVKLADLHSNLKNNPNESLARRYQKAIGILTNKSEPMDIAMRLLKDDDFIRDYFYQSARDSGIPEEEIDRAWEEIKPNWYEAGDWEFPIPPGDFNNLHPGDEGELEAATEGSRVYFPTTKPKSYEASPGIRRVVRHDDPSVGTFRLAPFNESTYFTTGEPMDLSWQLLKTPVSPEAKRHKLEYDKKYQDTPERIKYREDLNRERRQRGVYGKGGKDMSHTKDGKIVPEDASKNRARHFKERGTLKSFVLIKR